MTIAKEWGRYRELVVHPDAGPEQVSQLQRSFYAGALAISELIVASVSSEAEMTKEDETVVDTLMGELVAYHQGQQGDGS